MITSRGQWFWVTVTSGLLAQAKGSGQPRSSSISNMYTAPNGLRLCKPIQAGGCNEYEHVQAENYWTGAQVAQYPKRFVGFCSVNPLRPYALAEIARCAKNQNLRTGLHLHFGNSDVNLNSPEDLARVRRVFRAADGHHTALLVHLHSNVDHHWPYGTKEARTFLGQVIPEAPDVTVEIAHLAGAGGYDDPATDEALRVFVEAIERKDPPNEKYLL
jgi:predicted TIM-barrel fold metal-dependent hydrolase